jgi:lantibiotic modifying enzyme
MLTAALRTIKANWYILAPSLGLEILLFLQYRRLNSAKPQETIQFLATLIGGAAALFSYLTSIQDKRAEMASKFAERWNQPSHADIRDAAYVFVRERDQAKLASISSPSKGHKFCEEQRKQRKALLTYCNFYEEMAVALRFSRADEAELMEYFLTPTVETYEAVEKWILNEREVLGFPLFLEHFQWLHKRWKPKAVRRSAKAKRAR